jgi:hypothetical protein
MSKKNMTSENQKPHIDFSKASEPPRSIDLNQPDTAPVIEPDEVSKDDKLKLSGDDFDGEHNNPPANPVIKANLSGS